ncbi:MAG: hypothetical protein GY791_15440 [Alphaproteobacteria bacterium]|nr:hypothetical protein [Alphaproteobacteria bacterium]
MRKIAPALFASSLLLSTSAWAQSSEPRGLDDYLDPETREQAEQMMRESVERMLDAMQLFLEAVPQYDPPEMTPEGDIIIRRRNPRPAPIIEYDETEESTT